MKTARFIAIAFAAVASLSLMAQQAGASGQEQSPAAGTTGAEVNDSNHAHGEVHAGSGGVDASGSLESSSHVDTTQGPIGFGDAAASHAYEMSSVTGALEGKLDSKSARVGDRVVLRTTNKVLTADGTEIPKGARLVGRVTEVQAYDSSHGVSQVGIAFDRAELKNGQSFAIHTLIQGVKPSPSAAAMSSMNDDESMNAMGSGMGSPASGGGRVGRAGGGVLDSTGNLGGGAMQRTTATTSSVEEQAGAAVNANPGGGVVEEAGHGDLNADMGAHRQAAARAVPRPTAIPGVMLAGSSSASGMFLASRKNVEFESGTQMQLGIVRDSEP